MKRDEPPSTLQQEVRSSNEVIPALGRHWLTPLYDGVVAVTTRERVTKGALIQQAQLQAGQRVLDLGTGTGSLAILAKRVEPGVDIIGLDGDSTILEIAVRKARRAGTEIEFQLGRAQCLPFPGLSFDRVVSSLFFHHLSWADKAQAAQEISRVLKPGGQLHVADWGRPSNRMMSAAFATVQLLDGFANTTDHRHGRLPEVFIAAGFESVHQERTIDTMCGTLAFYSASKPRVDQAACH